jgi:hypothetical protein
MHQTIPLAHACRVPRVSVDAVRAFDYLQTPKSLLVFAGLSASNDAFDSQEAFQHPKTLSDLEGLARIAMPSVLNNLRKHPKMRLDFESSFGTR